MSQIIKSRILKPLAIVVGSIVLLIVAGGLFISLWLDPNNYKAEIQRLAAEQGIDLQLRGQIGWQLWPSLALSLEDVQLASSRTPEQPLAQIQKLAVVVELAPLLQRHISVAALKIDGVALTLARDQQGRSNWEIEAVAEQTQAQIQSPPVPAATIVNNISLFAVAYASAAADIAPDAQAHIQPNTQTNSQANSQAQPLDLAIDTISLNDVSLNYTDASSGQQVQLANLKLDIQGLNQEGELFPVQLTADVEQLNDLPGVNLVLTGDIRVQDQRVELQPLSLILKPLADDRVTPLELNLTGQLGLQAGFTEIGDMDLQLALQSVNLRQWLEALAVPLDTANAQALTHLEMTANIKGSGSVVKVSALQATLDDTRITGDIGYNQPDQLALLVNLNLDKINADDYLAPAQASSGKVAGAKVAGSAADSTSVANAYPAQMDANSSAKFDSSGKLDSSAKFDTSDKFDTSAKTGSEAALANEVKKAKADIAGANPSTAPDAKLPFDTLRELRMRVQLAIGELQVANAQLKNVAVLLRSNVGVAQLDTLSFNAYNGSVNASGQLDSRRAQARLHLEGNVTGVDLLGLLSDTIDEKRLQGAASMKFSGDSEGSSVAELQRRLSADVQLQAKALQVNDLDVERDLCQLAENLGGSKVAGQSWKGYTKLQDVSGNFALRNQVVQVLSLNAGMEALTVAASANGKINLAAQSFDLPINAKVTGSRDDTLACQIRDRWRNQDLPLRCRGSFDTIGARTCLPDADRLAVLLKQQGKQEVQQQLSDKLREKLGDEEGKQVEDLLRGLLGR